MAVRCQAAVSHDACQPTTIGTPSQLKDESFDEELDLAYAAVRIDESMNGGAEEKPKAKRDKTRVTKAQQDRILTAATNRAPGAGINAGGSDEPQERDPEQEPQTKRPSRPKAKPKPTAEPKPEAEETNVEPEKLPPAVWNSDPALAARLADF